MCTELEYSKFSTSTKLNYIECNYPLTIMHAYVYIAYFYISANDTNAYKCVIIVIIIIDDMHMYCNSLTSPNSISRVLTDELFKKIPAFLEKALLSKLAVEQFYQGRNKIFVLGTKFLVKISFPQNKFTQTETSVTGQTLFSCMDVIAS